MKTAIGFIEQQLEQRILLQSSLRLLLRAFTAGIWFAISVAVVMGAIYIYLHITSRSVTFDLAQCSAFILFPAVVGGVFGSVLGAGILKDTDPLPSLLAMFRGALVTSASFGLCIVILALRAALESVKVDATQFFWLVFLLMAYGGMFILPVAVAVGAGSGLILHSFARLADLRFWVDPNSVSAN